MWVDALPNLLIGLREGLEAGLVVSILLAAVRRSGTRSTASVWLGVTVASALALSFGAVLTFTEAALPAAAQDALAGALSLLAVALVTAMVFWMRTAARSLSGELRGKVAGALAIGGRALALTAFLAVAREGLEAALFLWTTVQASGSTVAPLVGAGTGIAVAVGVCVLMVRSAIKINIGAFFSRTAVLLVVVAAGVLAHGLGDLQQAGVLPGRTWLAFDLTGAVPTDTWWATIVAGITNLAPAMTWLQVVAYVSYTAVVVTLLRRSPATARPAPVPRPGPGVAAAEAAPQPTAEAAPSTTEVATPVIRRRRGRRLVAAGAAVGVPVLAAGGFLLLVAKTGAAAAREISISDGACAVGWTAPPAGPVTFTVANTARTTAEVYLVRASDGGVVGEIENLGPATRHGLTVDLPPGSYAWRCLPSGGVQLQSTAAQVSGAGGPAAAPAAVAPVSLEDLQGPTTAYRAWVAPRLATLSGQVRTIAADIDAGRLDAARTDWLPAQLSWDRIGAAYGSFGPTADAIDGSPDGLAGGVADPQFTGLRRLEYGLWHDQDPVALRPVAAALCRDVDTLRGQLPTLTADPTNLPLRAHEILEDALRDHLSGRDDQGAGAAYAETLADVEGTQTVLDLLGPLIDARDPQLRPAAATQAATLRSALRAMPSGVAPAAAPDAARQRVNAATSGLLETLSRVPTLLEVR